MNRQVFCNFILLFKVTAVLCFIGKIEAQTTQNTLPYNETFLTTPTSETSVRPLRCRYAPGIVVGNRNRTLECCARAARVYERNWSLTGRRLTTYLENLKAWECPQLQEECKQQLFAFSEYTRLVYDHFCDYPALIDKCVATINETYKRNKNNTRTIHAQISTEIIKKTHIDFSDNNTEVWQALIERFRRISVEFEDIKIPCVQIALYEAEVEHLGDFHEIIRVNLPSCEISWCGYDGHTLREQIISVWTCLSNSCKAKMIAIMVACGLLGLIITAVNLIVIVVYWRNPVLLHSQGLYKVSLAVADLLMGAIVFPSFIGTLSRKLLSRQQHSGDTYTVSGYNFTNGSLNDNITEVQLLQPAGRFNDIFSQTYLNAIGFFTIISFFVSIYTLTIAGFDRLSAVYRPLSYRKDLAKVWAKRLCVGIWVLGCLFSILPFFLQELRYTLNLSILVISAHESAIILYAIAFAIPLLLMWTVNFATLQFTKKHAKVRRHLTIDSKKKTHSMETRLARTLSLMVGAFTASLVPVAIVSISSLFAPTVNFYSPRTFKVPDGLIYNGFEFVTVIILACNSLWNFFIYSARNFEFRKAVKILYRNVTTALGIAACSSKCMVCARTVAVKGKRRFSNLPTLTTSSSGQRKKSSIPTILSNLTFKKTTDASLSESTNHSTSQSVTSTSDKIKDSKYKSTAVSSSHISETSIASEKQSKQPRYTRNQNHQKQKKDDLDMATDDSVFQSFAIDANADRLFVSVMENINEEITVENNTK